MGGGGFRLYPTKITDRNGNFILISYAGANGVGPKISSIQDTLNRYINFYYAGNGDLVTITAPGLDTSDLQVMRFYYTDVPLGSDLFDASMNAFVPTSVRTLQYVYLPASADGADPHAGYKFEYSPYGMIRQITQLRGMTVSSNSTTEKQDQQYCQVYFLNEKEGWLAGCYATPRLVQTKDGGKTWHKVETPTEPWRSAPVDVYFADSKKGWITTRATEPGNQEGVYRTTDGGQTWPS